MTEGSRRERVTGTPDIAINDLDDVIGGVAGGGGRGERATGTSNTIYNLSSVLFHALQGGASYDTYVEDAEREGDEELTEFFRRVREEDRDRAAEARMLLAERTPTALRAEEATADIAPRTEPSGDLSDIEPRAEGASSGDARRTYAITEMPDEDLTPPEDAVPPDAPELPGDTSRAEAGQSPPTGPVGAPSGKGDVQPGSTGEVASPRPEPTDDFPGTEPVREDVSRERAGEVPPPEEVPLERAGEIPMAEEVPAPRAEEFLADTQTQASLGDVTSPVPGDIPHEDMVPPTPPPPRGAGESPKAEEQRVEQEEGEEDRSLIDRLTDRVRDGLMGQEEQREEETGRPDRR